MAFKLGETPPPPLAAYPNPHLSPQAYQGLTAQTPVFVRVSDPLPAELDQDSTSGLRCACRAVVFGLTILEMHSSFSGPSVSILMHGMVENRSRFLRATPGSLLGARLCIYIRMVSC